MNKLVKWINDNGWRTGGKFSVLNEHGDWLCYASWARSRKGVLEIRNHATLDWQALAGLWQIADSNGNVIAKA